MAAGGGGGGREIKFLEGSGLMKSTSYVLIAVLELFFSCFSGFDLRDLEAFKFDESCCGLNDWLVLGWRSLM